MITDKEQRFIDEHCCMCGSNVCAGMNDVPARDGCEYYQKEILGQSKSDMEHLMELSRVAGKVLNLATFITNNWHSCPLPEDCGIDFRTECDGWGKDKCTQCLCKYSNKLNRGLENE